MQESHTEPPTAPQPVPFRPVPPSVSIDNPLPSEFSAPAHAEPNMPGAPSLPQAPAPVNTPATRSAIGKRIAVVLMVILVPVAVFFAWFCSNPPATPEETLATANQLVEQGDYESAFPLLKNAAESDMPPAYKPLAECYTEGLGTPPSPQDARFWYTKAEQNGDASATAALADLDYEIQNYAAALARYNLLGDSRTAEQSYRSARCCLFVLDSSHEVSRADSYLHQAVELYELAARQGHGQAAFELAELHYQGKLLPPSLENAAKWYTMAAEQGLAEAQFRLAWCLMESSPAQNETAVHWLSRAANAGHAVAAYDLAVCYLSGRGCEPDAQQAVHWLQLAAHAEHPAAMRRLAFCYRDAVAVPKNIPMAVHLFSQAAAAGDAEACYNLAWCLHHAYGVHKNTAAAISFYIKAAAAGFAPAQMALQDILIFRFLPPNYLKILQKSQNYPKL